MAYPAETAGGSTSLVCHQEAYCPAMACPNLLIKISKFTAGLASASRPSWSVW